MNAIGRRKAKKIAVGEIKRSGWHRNFFRRVKIREVQHTLPGKTESRDCFLVKVPVKGVKPPNTKVVIVDRRTGEILLNKVA